MRPVSSIFILIIPLCTLDVELNCRAVCMIVGERGEDGLLSGRHIVGERFVKVNFESEV